MKQKIFFMLLIIGFIVVKPNSTFGQAGTLDNSFSEDGKTTTKIGNVQNNGMSVVIQPDGKTIVAGYTNDFSNADFAVVRYNINGTLDNTFGGGDGIVTTDFGADDFGYSVALQGQYIVVAGYSGKISGYDFAVAKYTSTGMLDNTFGGGDGKVTTDFGNSDYGQSIAINQLSQKIVVAGYANNKFAVAQYNSNGTPDNTFSGDGKVTIDFAGGYDYGYSVAIQSNDSKIVVAGASGNNFAVARLLKTGILDNTFSSDGKLTTNFGATFGVTNKAYSVAIQEDKKIVVAGYSNTLDTADFAVARYLSTGALDNTFNGDGKVTTGFIRGNAEYGRSVAIHNDGKIVVAGYINNSSGSDFALARYSATGTLDNTFSGDGKVITDFGNIDYGLGVAIQKSNGKIVVAGNSFKSNFSGNIAVARYYSVSIQPPINAKEVPGLNKDNAGVSSYIKVYPNPATSILNITGLNPSAVTTISITSTTGVIKKVTTIGSSHTFDIKMLPAGIYHISIVVNKTITNLKFIKQ